MPRLQPDTVVIGLSSVDLNSGDPDTFWGPLTRSRGYSRVNAQTADDVAHQVEIVLEDWSALFRLRTVLREPVRVLLEFGNQDESDLQTGPFGAELRDEELDPYELTEEGKRRIREGQLADFRLVGRDLEMLDSLVRELTAQDIEVILLNMPMTDDFVQLHPSGEQDYLAYVSILEDLARRYEARLIDLGRAIESTDLFRDPSHLNYEGADMFTKHLASTLEDG